MYLYMLIWFGTGKIFAIRCRFGSISPLRQGGEIFELWEERKRGLSPCSLAARDLGASSSSEGSMALKQLLDRCYRHLESEEFGPLELATLEVSDCEDVARQLAFELNLPYSESIVEALAIWIQDAKGESGLLMRTRGLLADDIAWHQLAPPQRAGPVYIEETRPPPGIKAKELVQDGQELAARDPGNGAIVSTAVCATTAPLARL